MTSDEFRSLGMGSISKAKALAVIFGEPDRLGTRLNLLMRSQALYPAGLARLRL
jgi:hypothetical protein